MINGTFPFYCASGGGKWYACDSGTRFTGCCRRDPCETGCSPDNRLPAYFYPDRYEMLPDLECSEGEYFICSQNAFFGCCRSNACAMSGESGGCPVADLGIIILSSKPTTAQYYIPENYNQTLDISSLSPQSGNAISSTLSPSGAAAILHNSFPKAISIALVIVLLATLTSCWLLLSSIWRNLQPRRSAPRKLLAERSATNIQWPSHH